MNDYCMIESAFDNKEELNSVINQLLDKKLVASCHVIESESIWNWKNERSDGVCRIKACPRLREVVLGNDSFCDFKTFELCEVACLQSIDFGKESFHHSPQCILKSRNSVISVYQ